MNPDQLVMGHIYKLKNEQDMFKYIGKKAVIMNPGPIDNFDPHRYEFISLDGSSRVSLTRSGCKEKIIG